MTYYRHRWWLLCLARVCARSDFTYARGRSKLYKAVKFSAKYLEYIFSPAVHLISLSVTCLTPRLLPNKLLKLVRSNT